MDIMIDELLPVLAMEYRSAGTLIGRKRLRIFAALFAVFGGLWDLYDDQFLRR